MSFATNVKNEICHIDEDKSQMIAELSAFFRNNAIYDGKKIDLLTENANIVKRIFLLVKECYQVNLSFVQKKNNNFAKNSLYLMTIDSKVDLILKDLSVYSENGYYMVVPKEYITSSFDDARAYLRGTFLAKGSINDPKTSRYHLEFSIDTIEEAEFVQSLLNRFLLNAKVLTREKGYMVYLKEAEKISDFLRIIQATQALLYFEDIRIYRDNMNMTNRLNNMEQANMDKVVETALTQVKQIRYIEEKVGLDLLDEKTLELAQYRLKYPESSTKELSDIISLETGHPITKSGINHRFRKIKEFYNRLKAQEDSKSE